MAFNFIQTKIDGVYIVEPRIFADSRGYFFESYNQEDFFANGITNRFIQDNQSKSSYGVIRGLHCQLGEWSQAKLVRAIQGRVLDVAVDIRRGSPWFGKHVACELSGENHRQFFIPRGFAHGFAVLSEEAVFQYKCDNLYCPSSEGAIAWNDPALGINWGIPEADVLLSEKDKHHPLLADAPELFDYSVDYYAL